MRYSFAVVDDEFAAIDVIKTLMGELTNYECVFTSCEAIKSIDTLNALRPDLLFLDIEMPNLNGLDLLKKLVYPPIIILQTAYPHFAIDAFSLGVREYILKPISLERLSLALENIEPLLVARTKRIEGPNSLSFKNGHENILINPQNIVYISSNGNFSTFHLENGDTVFMSENLRSLTERLLLFGFVRVHKTHLVNQKYIVSFRADYVQVKDITLRVGRTFRDNLKHLFF